MSKDIISVEEFKAQATKKLKSKELQDYANAQYQQIEHLKKENDKLVEKITHLESVLSTVVQKSTRLAPEEVICIEQIEILKRASMVRELSLDEVKRLDLLVKNLRLIREQSTQVIDTKDYTKVEEHDLLAIARKTDI